MDLKDWRIVHNNSILRGSGVPGEKLIWTAVVELTQEGHFESSIYLALILVRPS